MDHSAVIEHTRGWIATIVIDLNLCPFARRVFEGNLIRYIVSDANTEAALLADLERELRLLADAAPSEIETTLLIHPHVLGDFLDYNDFLDPAEGLLADMGLEGVIQLASFHPQYRFDGTHGDAVENYTNRAPYPMLHLLREESITQVAGDADGSLDIPRRNIETLREIGITRFGELLEQIKKGAKRGR